MTNLCQQQTTTPSKMTVSVEEFYDHDADAISSDYSSDDASSSSSLASPIPLDCASSVADDSLFASSESVFALTRSNASRNELKGWRFESLPDTKVEKEKPSYLKRHKNDAAEIPTQPNKTGRVWYVLFFLFMLAFAQDVHNIYAANDSQAVEAAKLQSTECIYVPGGGFSGFWFTLGRLQSIPKEERLDHEYYCYSAGCLAVVASAIMDKNMEEMYDMAFGVQQQWRLGEIDRYSVVRTFLDELLFASTTSDVDLTGLSKIHIITTSQHGRFAAKTETRTATNLQELHGMLLQTTWIPFAIGDSLWQNQHMDGAFTAIYHPTCDRNIGLAMNLWLLANVVNVNLSRSGVETFWNLGLKYGSH